MPRVRGRGDRVNHIGQKTAPTSASPRASYSRRGAEPTVDLIQPQRSGRPARREAFPPCGHAPTLSGSVSNCFVLRTVIRRSAATPRPCSKVSMTFL